MKVLYLSYTGLLEPLGQSQVLAYLRGLSEHHSFTLISFEKSADLHDRERVAAMRRDCQALGVRWLPQRYHQSPRMLATAWDLTVFLALAAWQRLRGRAQLVHARSYIPAFVALVLRRVLGAPFIFDMRAFWPEEMVAAGRLQSGSRLYKLLKSGEAACLQHAAGVVSLTQAAADYMAEQRQAGRRHPATVVIPTCVDLDQFKPAAQQHLGRAVIGSVGTVLSGWFLFDWLAAFFSAFDTLQPNAEFRIVTTEHHDAVTDAAGSALLPLSRIRVFGVHRPEIPEVIRDLVACAMFYQTGLASLARAPTRMGEVLACGRPVVINAGVGDAAEIVRRYNVGVVVEDASETEMVQGARRLDDLLRDSQLPGRCRQAAEECFSLDRGVRAYNELYGQVAKRASL
ncbi:MAG: glycosyltransferase [Proteobacteria bacterium]|nr:glycosyltransferase [Pseudomonadota bacterium]MBW3617030.1 glycosyltransferase [Pseudomonadota bacterium]